MSDKVHRPAGIISVHADDNFVAHCLFCDQATPTEKLVLLMRRDLSSDWDAVCLACSIGIMGSVILLTEDYDKSKQS